MDEGNLFEFEGTGLVRLMTFSRTLRGLRLLVCFETPQGAFRLVFENPEPHDALLGLLEAEQVWIYQDRDNESTAGRIRVTYWCDGFREFFADAVDDLDSASYSTHPDLTDPDRQPGEG